MMIYYNCARCGYYTNRKSNIKTHLNRKKPCKPLLEDIDINTLKYNMLQESKIHKLNKEIHELKNKIKKYQFINNDTLL
jgi:hypothetical protein